MYLKIWAEPALLPEIRDAYIELAKRLRVGYQIGTTVLCRDERLNDESTGGVTAALAMNDWLVFVARTANTGEFLITLFVTKVMDVLCLNLDYGTKSCWIAL